MKTTSALSAGIMVASAIPTLIGGQAHRRIQSDTGQATAFVGVTVIPMDGPGVRPMQTVVVRAGRIVALGRSRDIMVPLSARRIDGAGRYLIPGLVDAHVHLFDESSIPDFSLYLANGVTTIRNMQGAPLHLRLRDEIARGVRLGPTLLTTSAFVDPDSVRSPEAARRFVQVAKSSGYDAIKLHAPLSPALYTALTAEARRVGIPVVGHAPGRPTTLADAARAGQRTIEHAESVMQQGTDQQKPDTMDIVPLVMQLRHTGTCVTPTLAVFQNVIGMTEQYPALAALTARVEMRYVDPALRAYWMPDSNEYVTRWRGHEEEIPGALAKFRRQYLWMQALTRRLSEAGVPIVAGTDASGSMVIPGFSLPEELRLLHAAGLTTHQALTAATRDAAICLGGEREFGTITVGKRADLVLLAHDPLQQLETLRAPVGVMVRGRWLARAELLREVRPR